MNILAFDIETIPDVAGGRRLLELGDDLSNEQVAEAMFTQRRAKTGSDFIATHLFDGVDKHTPTLVTWNGSGFDLPVLHYRGLINNVQAPRYWDLGEDDSNFKWNNYIGRFHLRHTDLMDVLAGYNNRAFAPLDEIAVLLGFPGKMGMSGSKVWQQFCAGEIKAIRDYCETDALNTYLVYLHWLFIRGQLTDADLQREHGIVKGALKKGAPHLQEFLSVWEEQT